ncbi:MAG TPA: hypothetical protein VFB12_15815, partial [Ktedonobacteraceae bacterium]|nr:hypothetical protein [Ktedonobacteraceae bacterium]
MFHHLIRKAVFVIPLAVLLVSLAFNTFLLSNASAAATFRPDTLKFAAALRGRTFGGGGTTLGVLNDPQ